MITLKTKGDFKKTKRFFNLLYKRDFIKDLEYYAEQGLGALSAATPVDTGKTAASWGYSIDYKPDTITITWSNYNVVDSVPVVILIQYGHATESGKFVSGLDFINPALRPVFNKLSDDIWEEVKRL